MTNYSWPTGVPRLSRRECIATSLLFSVAPFASADTRQERLQATLHRLVNEAEHPVCGVAAASLRRGRVDLIASAGLARVASATSQAQPFDEDSLLRIASLSKMVTTLGVMRLVEEGRLKLDADVSQLLGFPLRHPEFPKTTITLRMLLSHQAGLDDAGGYFWQATTSLREALKGDDESRHWAPGFAPGKRFSYSNLGWSIAGTVMEVATGERFDRLMRRLVLDPLGVRGDYNPHALASADQARLAGAYILDANGSWALQRDGAAMKGNESLADLSSYVPGRNATVFSPTGGLRASVNDLIRIAQLLLRRIPSVMKERSLAERERTIWQYNPRRTQDDIFEGAFLAWGLGVQRFIDQSKTLPNGRAWGDRLTSKPGWKAWGHEGFAYGALTGLYYRPETGDALIYLINGTRDDVDTYRARHSSHHRYQEQILDALTSA